VDVLRGDGPSVRFKEIAREAEADGDEEALTRALKKVALSLKKGTPF
jgi:hypothetical protein